MASYLQAIMAFWSSALSPEKKFDVENPRGAVESSSRRFDELRLTLPQVSTKSIGIASYSKTVEVPVCLASLDATRTVGAESLRYTDEKYEAPPQERLQDKSDIVLKLGDLIASHNFCSGENDDDDDDNDDEAERWQTKFDGRAVVVEIAIKVTDQRWDPHRRYLRVEVDNLPPMQQNTVVVGDRSTVLAHAIARRTSAPAKSSSCSLPNLAGWCHQCSAGPNMITVYQMPLVNADLFKYATEILSATGTHGHIRDAPGLPVDEQTPISSDTRLELNPISTIARDLCLQKRATLQRDSADPGGRSNVFALHSDWTREVLYATDSVLVNVPFADLKSSTLRIAARGDSLSLQETLQGVSANVIYCEEAAYMDLGVFYEVIVPLMEVAGTATICISTPLGTFNFYSELTNVRDDKGKLVFNVRHIKGGKAPSWKPEEARSKVQAIYGGRQTLFRREIMGEIADEGENMAFSPAKLKELFDKPLLPPPYAINDNMIYIAIDPNGGASASDASGSDTAIVSFINSQGRVVIVGLESHPTKTPAQPRQMLYAHIEALRRQPCFHNCKFMLIPEANLGDQAQLLAQVALRRFRDVEVMCQKSHCYGVFTAPHDKEKFVMRMRDKLSERGVFFHDKLVCANPYQQGVAQKDRLEAVLKEFQRQLVSFRAIHIVPANLTAPVRVVYSGKADKDNKRSNRSKDDMCMAFLFGFYFSKQYESPNNLISARDSHNMLRLELMGGTVLEGAPQAAVVDPSANDASHVAARKRSAVGGVDARLRKHRNVSST